MNQENETNYVRIFKSRYFKKFAKNEGISDAKLRQVIKEAEAGNIDADYGGGVIKQRIARPGQGKSSGYRTIIFYRRADRAFFVYGYAKKDQDNISRDDVYDFKQQAKALLAMNAQQIASLLQTGIYMEIGDEE